MMTIKIALWICPYPYVTAYLRNPGSIRYEFVGWEEVEGHKCAVVNFFGILKATGERVWANTYWLDLERGGHALKVEKYAEGQLAARTFDIRLAEVETVDGKTVWFPISGSYETFGNGLFTYSKNPVTRQTYEVLRGSLRINQSLKDARFTLDWKLGPESRFTESRKRAILKEGRSKSAEVRVNEALKKADSESEELVATSPSRRGWFARNAAMMGLLSVGLLILLTAEYLRRRM